ncbi:hypothetical protein [Pantoea agglomerans]|uniref:hypothetical protein n=1 Tax=Enterobacter agglomerans TaxID=549 RepID=UPI003DA0CC22
MDKESILTLLKYKRWIDAETLKSVKQVSATTYAEKRYLMLRLMNHIFVTDTILKAHMTGQSDDLPAPAV